MGGGILVNVTPRETRMALIEGGMVQELHIERSAKMGYVGNIYYGKVARIMPGMQAAFVDIGLERAAFLHVNDIEYPAHLKNAQDEASTPLGITDLLHDGEEVVVQVIKDPISSKSARISTQISIPSRYLVTLPQGQNIGVSSKIEEDEERQRLRQMVSELRGDMPGGFIIRTNAEGISQEALANDWDYLRRVWVVVQRRMGEAKVGECIYEELSLPLRAMRDFFNDDTQRIRVDSNEWFAKMKKFADQFMPQWTERLEHYEAEVPIFDLYGVDDEIVRALEREVPLKSGGSLVIDQTEAMTTIDVNTGSFLGSNNQADTIFRTNLEAAQAVARQLRLRNLGGIIIIDFIDMHDAEHRRQVMRQLDKSLANDSTRTTTYDFSPLGLVEMTRKRTTESLARQLCEPCPVCEGRGAIRTAETIVYAIFREVTRSVRQFDAEELLVLAAPKVVHHILEEESNGVAELEEFIGKTIRFQANEQYRQDQFDVVLL